MLNDDQKTVLEYLRRSKADSIKRDAADIIEYLVSVCEELDPRRNFDDENHVPLLPHGTYEALSTSLGSNIEFIKSDHIATLENITVQILQITQKNNEIINRMSEYFPDFESNTNVEKPVTSFDLSLAAVDAYDPQSFINGAKWQASQTVARDDVLDALVRLERAVDLHLGRSAWTQTRNLKGMAYSEAIRKELFDAHDEARAAIQSTKKGEGK